MGTAALVARRTTGQFLPLQETGRQPAVEREGLPDDAPPYRYTRLLMGLVAVVGVAVIFVIAGFTSGNGFRISALSDATPIVSGRTGPVPASATPVAPPGTVPARPAAPLLSAQPSAFSFQGKGPGATPEFAVQEGVLLFDLHHEGEGAFSVKVFDKSGIQNPVDVISVRRRFDGAVAWSVGRAGLFAMKPGQYTLGVDATGSWRIILTQPRPSGGKPVPLTLTGDGTAVTEPFNLERGTSGFRMENQTSAALSSFVVRLLKLDGSKEEGLANELPSAGKPAQASRQLGIKASEAGLYLLSVRAEGPWSVSIE